MSDKVDSSAPASKSKTKQKPEAKGKGKAKEKEKANSFQDPNEHLKSRFGTAAPSSNKKKSEQPISSIPLPTSQLFVDSLRKDIDILLTQFSESWIAALEAVTSLSLQQTDLDSLQIDDHQSDSFKLLRNGPLALFSEIWVQKGWNYVHLVVGEDDTSRTAFYEVINRIFQEHLLPFYHNPNVDPTAAPNLQTSCSQKERLKAVGSLLGMYLLYSTQPTLDRIWTSVKEDHDHGTRPMHKIVIEMDLYRILLQLPVLTEDVLTVSESIGNFLQFTTPSSSRSEARIEFIQPMADIIQILRILCDEQEAEERAELKSYLNPNEETADHLSEMDHEEDGATLDDTNKGQSVSKPNNQTTIGEMEKDAQAERETSTVVKSRPRPRPVASRKGKEASDSINISSISTGDPKDPNSSNEVTAETEATGESRDSASSKSDRATRMQSLDGDSASSRDGALGEKRKIQGSTEQVAVGDDQGPSRTMNDVDQAELSSKRRRVDAQNHAETSLDQDPEAVEGEKLNKLKFKGKEKEKERERSEGNPEPSTSSPLVSTSNSKPVLNRQRIEPRAREQTPLDEYIQDSAFIIIPPTGFSTRSSIPDNSIQTRSDSDKARGSFGKLVTTTEAVIQDPIIQDPIFSSHHDMIDQGNQENLKEVKEKNLSRAEMIRSVIRAKLGLTLDHEPAAAVLGNETAEYPNYDPHSLNQVLHQPSGAPSKTTGKRETVLKIPNFKPPYNYYQLQARSALSMDPVGSNFQRLEESLEKTRRSNEEKRNRFYTANDGKEQGTSSSASNKLPSHEELLQAARLKALESVRSAKMEIGKRSRGNGSDDGNEEGEGSS